MILRKADGAYRYVSEYIYRNSQYCALCPLVKPICTCEYARASWRPPLVEKLLEDVECQVSNVWDHPVARTGGAVARKKK